jgi:hypothetical protein
MEQYKLTIELVPKTSWYTNVRSNVSKDKWDTIRKKSYKLANNQCEICGDTGKNQGFKHNVECHEIWHYNEITRTQKLTGLISLCPYCHKCKHPGLAQINGEIGIVIKHLMKINNLSENEAKMFIASAFVTWSERSSYEWTVDISYIEKYLNE